MKVKRLVARFLQSMVKNRRILAGAAILAACLTVGGSLAWLSDTAAEIKNIFKPSVVTCSVTETVTGSIKSSVKITNTGDTTAYIRVAVVGNSVNADGAITGAEDVSSALNVSAEAAAGKWVKIGDYYYWTSPVAPNELTGELLKESIDLNGKQVTILADAIQSEPLKAITEAWGVNPTTQFGD